MGGPVLVIELAEAVPDEALVQLHGLLMGLSTRFVEKRPGHYDINVPAKRLGIEGGDGAEWERPFLVSLMGPGVGDEDIFNAEHEDESVLAQFLGFRPTHAIDVIAMCNRPVDHAATALLTAAIMDVVGGVANVELGAGQDVVVDGLPGVLAQTDHPWRVVMATGMFLRDWVKRPGFRLVK